MARLTKPLAPTNISEAKPKEKLYRLFDGNGLALAIHPSGKKVFQYRYKDPTGKEKTLTLGEYSTAYGLADARQDRDEYRRLLGQGKDPVTVKRQREAERARDDDTFEKIAVRCIGAKSTTDKHKHKMLRSLQIHIFPKFGHMKIADIPSKDLYGALMAIAGQENTTNKRGQKKTYMARKVCAWCAEIYDFASMERGDFDANNPCRLIIKKLPSHRVENNKQIPIEELPPFLSGLDKYKGLARYAIYMMLYTGFRQISLRRAQWKDFDLSDPNNEVWNRKPEKHDPNIHQIPLSKQAVKILEEIRPLTYRSPDSLVFQFGKPDREGLAFSEGEISRAIKKIIARKNLSRMQAHGIRGLFTTILNEMGFDSRWVEKQTGHAIKDSTQGAYNKAVYFPERKKMLQEWADHVDTMRNQNA